MGGRVWVTEGKKRQEECHPERGGETDGERLRG